MLIDGKAVASEIREKLAESFKSLIENRGKPPTLRLVSVGDDPAANSYIRSKIKYGEKIGVRVEHNALDKGISEKQLMQELSEISKDKNVNGIVLEAPLPGELKHVDCAQAIAPSKDVDCITSVNQGRIVLNREFMLPATAESIRILIEKQDLPKGSRVAIINRSPVIGRPLAMMLLNRDYTVTVCHSKTRNVKQICKESDVIVVAVARPGFLNSDYVTERSIVIDAGINFVDEKMTGDADFDSLSSSVKAISPVPGGVGPVTTACIFSNLLIATDVQMKNFETEIS